MQKQRRFVSKPWKGRQLGIRRQNRLQPIGTQGKIHRLFLLTIERSRRDPTSAAQNPISHASMERVMQ